MKFKQTTVLLVVSSLLLLLISPVSAMEIHTEGDRLILTGPLSGFELTQFSALLTSKITTVVFTNSGGGDFAAGLNLASLIRQRRLVTVAKGFCRSSCANAFLGGVQRFLADGRSYAAFHGHYDSYGKTLQGQIGELRNFYAEMTGGKVSDDLVQLWLQKPRAGMVYFFRHQTYSCNGDEPKRPSGCEKLGVTALDQGIITSLDDVELNQAKLNNLPITSERGRTEYEHYLEATLPKAFAISPDKSHFA